MSRESFENPHIAKLLNENFINIKVDREERPDIDSIYMDAVVALTGHGGWPLSVFLSPDGKPFYGGTYFPPVRRYNLPSFEDVVVTVTRLWVEDREKILNSADQVTEYIRNSSLIQRTSSSNLLMDLNELQKVVQTLAKNYDWKYGGWGQAPKFPHPMIIEFLLRFGSNGDRLALDLAFHALKSMSKGGMYDLIGGGFSRYSTDNEWLVPHFEKMLYDNVLLSRVYLYAYLLSRDEKYLEICRKTLDFILRELTSGDGGFLFKPGCGH